MINNLQHSLPFPTLAAGKGKLGSTGARAHHLSAVGFPVTMYFAQQR
jgi:hypothetical protein